MRSETNRLKLEAFMAALGKHVRGPGRIYLAGGATAVLHGWRDTTIDIDLKPDPEPPGLFEALGLLKEQLDINVELVGPDQFIPPVIRYPAVDAASFEAAVLEFCAQEK